MCNKSVWNHSCSHFLQLIYEHAHNAYTCAAALVAPPITACVHCHALRRRYKTTELYINHWSICRPKLQNWYYSSWLLHKTWKCSRPRFPRCWWRSSSTLPMRTSASPSLQLDSPTTTSWTTWGLAVLVESQVRKSKQENLPCINFLIREPAVESDIIWWSSQQVEGHLSTANASFNMQKECSW